MIFLLSLIVLVVVSAVLGVKPTIYILEAIIPLINILLLTFGVGMILATVGVYFRDIEYLWSVAIMLIMYSSAIFYPAERILNSKFSWILKLNPIYGVIANFRNNVLYGQGLDVKLTLYSFGFSIVAIIVGLVFFKKKQDNFILHI